MLNKLENIDLPIIRHIDSICSSLKQNNNLVLQAEPGAGKTTIVPIALLDIIPATQKIIILVPRRLAARSAASRMAGLLNQRVGETVGFRIRNETKVSPGTRIEIITEGILTRMIQSDPELPGVGLIIFDEFHERSINADLGLAFALEIQQTLREDLKLLVMSATLDVSAVSRILDNASIISCEGRCYPVSVTYLAPGRNRNWSHVLLPAISQSFQNSEQDILVFLPGIGEITRAKQIIDEQNIDGQITDNPTTDDPTTNESIGDKLEVLSLYGDLPIDKQRQVLLPNKGKRKIILATNIAETSVTIEGVGCVIDCGLVRQTIFDPNVGFDRLHTKKIAIASATQRAGRAGRVSSGYCYRLWPESDNLRAESVPEIMRVDLAGFALELAQWGIDQPDGLNLLDYPYKGTFNQAQYLLRTLNALDQKNKITAHGSAILATGVHPRIGHMLMSSRELGATHLACLVAVMLEEKDVLQGEGSYNPDFSHRINVVLNSTNSLHRQIINQAKKLVMKLTKTNRGSSDFQIKVERSVALLPILLAMVFPDRIAQKRGSGYRLTNGGGVQVSENFTLDGDFLVVVKLGGKQSTPRIFQAIEITMNELEKYFSHLFYEYQDIYWDNKSQMVKADKKLKFGELVVKSQPIYNLASDLMVDGLLQGINATGLKRLPWSNELKQWQARVIGIRRISEYHGMFPDVSDQFLQDSLSEWLAPYLSGMNKLNQITADIVTRALLSLMDWETQQKLDQLMPKSIRVASGSQIKVEYLEGDKPVLAVKLQEMFGESETPKIAKGKIPVVIHLLSPARRPLQITEDLGSFWRNSYQDVKKEMKGRYPKHPWPDDPLNAEATRYTKKRNKLAN